MTPHTLALEACMWRLITDPPAQSMPVLFYAENTQTYSFRTGEPVEVPAHYAIEYSVGYWDGEAWRESGTNHEVFEFVEPGEPNMPTHWMPLHPPGAPLPQALASTPDPTTLNIGGGR